MSGAVLETTICGHKFSEGGEQRPEETLSAAPQRVGVIGGPDAPHADVKEHLEGYLGRVGRL
jgi:hypothetical protein